MYRQNSFDSLIKSRFLQFGRRKNNLPASLSIAFFSRSSSPYASSLAFQKAVIKANTLKEEKRATKLSCKKKLTEEEATALFKAEGITDSNID